MLSRGAKTLVVDQQDKNIPCQAKDTISFSKFDMQRRVLAWDAKYHKQRGTYGNVPQKTESANASVSRNTLLKINVFVNINVNISVKAIQTSAEKATYYSKSLIMLHDMSQSFQYVSLIVKMSLNAQ